MWQRLPAVGSKMMCSQPEGQREEGLRFLIDKDGWQPQAHSVSWGGNGTTTQPLAEEPLLNTNN